jgi:membrane dipeptidase
MKNLRIVDLHADFPHEVIKKRPLGEHRVLERRFLSLLRKGSVGTVIAPIWLTPEFKPNGLKRGLQIADAFLEDIAESQAFRLVTNYKELLDAERKKKIGLIMGCEGGEIIEDDVDLLHIYYRLGLRVFGFMWNQRNLLADGWEHADDDRGLSDFGKQVVEETERMGIVIDLAHMARKGWWGVMDTAKHPLIVSHTSTRGPPNASDRAMTDDQLRAVASNGGIIGIIAVYSERNIRSVPDLKAYCDHVEYVAKVAGPEHVGLGPDLGYWFFENGVPETFAGWTDWRMTKDLEDHSKLPDVLRELSRRGMSDREIRLIARDNFVRVFKQVVR